MKALNISLGFFVLLASILAAPAVLGSVVAGAAGLLLMVSAGQALAAPVVPFTAPPAIVRVVDVKPVDPDPVTVFELECGRAVVVFRQVNGKLVSRCYRV